MELAWRLASVAQLRSKARNAAWSFAWFDAPSLIDSVSGDGGVHGLPTVPSGTFSRL